MRPIFFILFCLCVIGCSKPNYEEYTDLVKEIQKHSELFKMSSPDVHSSIINDEAYSKEDEKDLHIVLKDFGISKSDFDKMGSKMMELNISLFHIIDDKIFFNTGGGLGESNGYVMVGNEIGLNFDKEYRIDSNYIVQIGEKCEGKLYCFST